MRNIQPKRIADMKGQQRFKQWGNGGSAQSQVAIIIRQSHNTKFKLQRTEPGENELAPNEI